MTDLFASFTMGARQHANRIAMALMTPSCTPNDVPDAQTAFYYARPVGAGLIVDEGTSILPSAGRPHRLRPDGNRAAGNAIRLLPDGSLFDMSHYPDVEQTYLLLANELAGAASPAFI